MISLAHHVTQVHCAQTCFDARNGHRREGDELVAQHILIVHIKSDVSQIRTADVKGEGLVDKMTIIFTLRYCQLCQHNNK